MNNNDIQKQLAKLRRNKKFLWLSILFLVLIIFWILVSIFATTKTSVISQELRDLSKSFVPRLESKVFDEILIKRSFSDEELNSFSVFVLDKNNVDGDNVVIDIMAAEAVEEEPEEFIEEVGEEESSASVSAEPEENSTSDSSEL